ncbi:MAG: MFS transporter [Rhodocyclaceae bacterium]|jgi:MFS family permease|nr:MFS transporter [Rhodocyclaceae bacterium]
MKQQAGFYGWKLLVAVFVITAINSGFTYYGGNIMNSHMAVEMNLDRKSLGLAFATYGLCIGLVVPLVGYWVTRWGARRALAGGALSSAIGALAMATLVNDMTGVLIAYGLVMGIGSSLGGLLPAQTLMTHWFRARLAMVLTIMLTGTLCGGFIAAPLFEKVITTFNGNWRAGWVLMAAASGVSCLLALLFVRNRPADLGQLQDGGVAVPAAVAGQAATVPGVYKTDVEWSFRDTVRHPTLWMLAAGTICFLSAFGMMVGHGVVHFKDLGHDAATAALFLGLLPLAGLGGKAVVATLGDRVEPRFIWGGAMAVMGIGLALGVNATSVAALYGAALLLGVGNAAAYPCMVTLVANYFGKAAYASLMGVMLLIGALSTSAGPLAAGVVFDRFGSYLFAFYPAAALCLLGGVMILFARPPRPALAGLAHCPTA